MAQTVVEKIAQRHMADGPRHRPLRAGDFLSIRPRHVMTHDNTAPVMKTFGAIGASRVQDPRQPVFILDHDIQNQSPTNLAKYASIEAFARQQGVDFYPAGTGIGHQVMVEQLYVVPGSFVVASDSHSNMYGAMGAVGTPVVRTDAAAIWATGTFWWQIPRTVRVELHGELSAAATGKDVIIALCGLYNRAEVLNAAVEFVGPGVATLSMDERLAIANMTTEWGALVGWFAADATTFRLLRRRLHLLSSGGCHRISEEDLGEWEQEPLAADDGASYAGSIELDLAEITPHVSGPDSVQIATPLAEIEAQRLRIQKAYLVSCVNSRLEDIAAAAAVVGNRKVAAGVEFYIAAASKEVQEDSQAGGHWQTLLNAGAEPLPPGCGPCIGLGAGLLEPGEIGISATNRNFKGRMGSREARCYLASPAVVASSAIAGYIRGPEETTGQRLQPHFQSSDATGDPEDTMEILPGFPEQLEGRLLFLPEDNLNTDGIYGKDYTYRDDMTPEMMAKVIFENYDPKFVELARSGDIILGCRNFGTGSSREQAVTALQAKGIALVIAGSFSQTYLRNAFNNGFACIVCPEVVDRTAELLAEEVDDGTKTIVTGDTIAVDFASGWIVFRNHRFRFMPLGPVPQALVVAGGVENQVREQLGLN